MWSTETIREKFLQYFRDLDHIYINPIFIKTDNKSDNSSLFTKSGYNNLQRLCNDKVNNLKNVVYSQRCLRVTGENIDYETIGENLFNNTYFEMLGNFSFSDNWKEEYIKWSFCLLTEIFKLDPKRLFVTYFEGDADLNQETDIEIRDLWSKYLPKEQIISSGSELSYVNKEDYTVGTRTKIYYDTSVNPIVDFNKKTIKVEKITDNQENSVQEEEICENSNDKSDNNSLKNNEQLEIESEKSVVSVNIQSDEEHTDEEKSTEYNSDGYPNAVDLLSSCSEEEDDINKNLLSNNILNSVNKERKSLEETFKETDNYKYEDESSNGEENNVTDTRINSRETGNDVENSEYGMFDNKRHSNLLELWSISFLTSRDSNQQNNTINSFVFSGMGLERLSSIVQGKNSNYDIDIFDPIISELNFLASPTHTYTGKMGDDDLNKVDKAYRLVSDHIRTIVTLISDGVSPDNNYTGLVLKKFIRQAIRYGLINLRVLSYNERGGTNRDNYPEFLHRLVPIVCKTLGDWNPKLRNDGTVKRIATIVKNEEKKYIDNISRGLQKFQNLYDKYRKKPEYRIKKVFKGEDIYNLYKTYGFPLDFSIYEARKRGFNIELEGYYRLRDKSLKKEKVKNNRRLTTRPRRR